MKILFTFLLLLNISAGFAQQSKNPQVFNYVEYADSVRETGKSTKLLAGNVRMWFNDSVSYQQTWLPQPTITLNPSQGKATEQDSLTASTYKRQSASLFYAQKVNVCKIAAANGEKRMYFDYDIRPGKTTVYVSPNVVSRDSIDLNSKETKIILGFKCNLALFSVKGAEGNLEVVKVWYTKEIALPFGPQRYAQQLAGMVMKVESSLHNYTVTKLEIPGSGVPNFDLDPKKDELFTYEDVYAMFKKRYENSLKTANKQ